MVVQKKAVLPRVMTEETHELIKNAIIKGTSMQDACDRYGVTKEVYLAFDATVIQEASPRISNAEKLRIVQAVDKEKKEGYSTAEACLLVDVEPHQYYNFRKSLGTNPASVQVSDRAVLNESSPEPLRQSPALKAKTPLTRIIRSYDEKKLLVDQVEAHLKEGMGIRQACEQAGIPNANYYIWRSLPPTKEGVHVGIRRTPEEKIRLLKLVDELVEQGTGQAYACAHARISTASYQLWKSDLDLVAAKTKLEQPLLHEPSPSDSPVTLRTHEEKQRLVALVDDYMKQGMGVKRACHKVGISDPSYRTWKVQSVEGSETAYSGIHRTPEERSALVKRVDGFLAEGFSRRESCAKARISPISYDTWKSKEQIAVALAAQNPTPPEPEVQRAGGYDDTWSKARRKEVLLMIEREYVDGTEILAAVHRRHGMTPGTYYKALESCGMKSPTKKRERLGLIPIRSVLHSKRMGGVVPVDTKQIKELRARLLKIEAEYLAGEEPISDVFEKHGFSEGTYARSLAKCKMISGPAKRAELGKPALARLKPIKIISQSQTTRKPKPIYRYLPWAAMALLGGGQLAWMIATMSK